MPSNTRQIRWLARFFILSMVFLHAYFLSVERGHIQRGYPDFSIFYTAGRMIRFGMGPLLYTARAQFLVQQQFTSTDWLGPLPFNHPAFEALPFVPFTFLPYVNAFVLWNMLNLAALFPIAIVLRRHSRTLSHVSLLDCWLALLAFFPVFATVLQGQDSIMLLLLFALGYDALSRGNETLAGVWLGLALFKFQFAIPLVVILFLWGWRKVGAAFAATGAALLVISLGVTGWEGMLRYPGFLTRVAAVPLGGRTPPDVMPNLHGLIEGWGSWPPPRQGLIAVALVSVVFLIWGVITGAKFTGDLPRGFSFAVLTSILVSYQINPHDLTLLMVPMVLLLDRIAPHQTGRGWNWGIAAPWIPLLVSPIWITVWLVVGHTNTFVLLLLWATMLIATRLETPQEISAS